jgi:hypothetical protein
MTDELGVAKSWWVQLLMYPTLVMIVVAGMRG